jgi:hypothetical protein
MAVITGLFAGDIHKSGVGRGVFRADAAEISQSARLDFVSPVINTRYSLALSPPTATRLSLSLADKTTRSRVAP